VEGRIQLFSFVFYLTKGIYFSVWNKFSKTLIIIIIIIIIIINIIIIYNVVVP